MRLKFSLLGAAFLAATGVGIVTLAEAAVATATFQVKLTITPSCVVTAGAGSDIDLGAHAASETNVTGTNSIKVNCSKTTPYNIGLAPSTGNAGTTAGAGNLAAVAGPNTDKVPYQLFSDAAFSTVWGNTATSIAVGNGVAGIGDGTDQSYPVYVKAASVNFTPDSYADTVTVNVNF